MFSPEFGALVAVFFSATGIFSLAANGADVALQTPANVPVEITFTAQRPHTDPFADVVLDVTFTDPAGVARKVPAFWAGGAQWKVRYASPLPGAHRWKSICNDTADAGLQGMEGTAEVTPYTGDNPLFLHGPVCVAEDKRHFEHADGTPFFWLGDTWWMGLCHRLHWPDEFQRLTADRKAKGFNVVQIVAGLYPDMHPFDPRGANEAGFPWEADYARIRPEYFDAADARLRHLVEQGITPCIVGAWGYFLPWMGVEKMQAHWRYLIARYGSWPVIWCAAGEANLPWYLAKGFPYDDREQVHGWTEVLRSIHATDPFHRPLTIHPTGIGRLSARNATDDVALLDFDLLQTPHGQRDAVAPAVRTVRESFADHPVMPVINGEASYEKLGDSLPTEWTRAMFWLCLVNGAKGHTYGANGIWQLNRPGQPHGPSPNGPPNGTGYGVITWEEAMHLPGSTQVALGKRFFESLPWTELTPMPESVAWANANALGDWIWFAEGDPKTDAPIATRYFRRIFDLPPDAAVLQASLRVAVDDRFAVSLNDQELGAGADWHAPSRFDARAALRPGRNVLLIRAENVHSDVPANPAGCAAALSIDLQDGTNVTIRTDASWQAASAPSAAESAWSAALVTAKMGEGPWGRIDAAAPAEQPQACGIGDRLRVIYALDPRPLCVRQLAPNAVYRATHFDPATGERTTAPAMRTDAAGEWRTTPPAHGHDWVMLLEAQP